MLININAQMAATSTMLPWRLHRRYGAFSMIKDIIVHLEHRIARDSARDLPFLLRRPLTRMSP
jgi:hypothetical protein